MIDADGQPLVASHASRGAQRYRYYVSRDLQLGSKNDDGLRIPAPEIEKLVCDRIALLFDDPVALLGQISPGTTLPDHLTNTMAICRNTAGLLRGTDLRAIATLIASVIERIEVRRDGVTIRLARTAIAVRLNIDPVEAPQPIEIAIAVKLKRAGFALRLILPNGVAASAQTDDRLLKTIATAQAWGSN